MSGVLEFMSMCRAYKPLLAAQRQKSTLVAILDYLMPLVGQCSTSQIATLLLDLAFIGCQSFKAHGILPHISNELYIRVQTGALGKDHAIELADAIRALDKLDHCHDALSHAAGMIQAFFSFVYTCFTFATLHICFRKECGVELHVLLHSH
jgi:hypothetical protein